jgi:hypothetical protein
MYTLHKLYLPSNHRHQYFIAHKEGNLFSEVRKPSNTQMELFEITFF